MAGFSGFDPVIRRYGGIAARRELRRAGWSETDLWFAWRYGNLDRIRIGWYASSDLPGDAPDDLVVHWSTADRYSGSRRAVSPAVALRQAHGCARRGSHS